MLKLNYDAGHIQKPTGQMDKMRLAGFPPLMQALKEIESSKSSTWHNCQLHHFNIELD